MNSKKTISSKTVSLLLVGILSLAATIMSGCAEDRDTAGVTTSGTPKAKMSNSDLETAIKAKFDADPQLKAADLSTSADAERNEVTLSGTVETQALRTKALELAKSAHAGLVITDKIDVKPRELTRAEWTEDRASEERSKAKEYGDTIGDSLDDAWIHTKIVAKLIGNSMTPERKINVDVTKNAVTLRGTVDTAAAKAEAERVAKATEGVTRVTNQLKVGAAKTASPSPTVTKKS